MLETVVAPALTGLRSLLWQQQLAAEQLAQQNRALLVRFLGYSRGLRVMDHGACSSGG